jgi:hypothetical protein
MLVTAALTVAPLLAADDAVAAPRCSLAALHDPCDDATPAPRSDRATPVASPWLAEGPPPPWMAPAIERGPGDHRVGSMAALGGLYASFATWMYFAWYHDQPRLSGFAVGGDGYFGENTYAGGADKLGHAWANLALTRGGAELLRWGGWRSRTASVISASLSWSLFLFVEIKDGYYYQLSPGDMVANTVGAALGAAMTEWPALDRLIDLRVSYWPSPEYRSIVDGTFTGNDRINSVNIAEDYSGQTYFLAVHLGAVPRPAATPRWLGSALDYVDLGVGFHATKYKPDPPDDPPYLRRQRLFLGATIDLQRLVDRGLRGRRHRAARVTGAIGHGVLELLSPPFVILPLASTSRSPDQ